MIVPIGPEGSSLMYGLPLVLYLLFLAHDVPEKQMEDFMRVLEEPDAVCTDIPYAKGDRVKVIRGALRGVEGEIAETPDGAFLIVRVSTLLCAKVRIPRGDALPAES